MKNLIKIFFSLVILNLILNANADAQTVTWSKWYDYNHMENEAEVSIQTIDGGYLILTNNFRFIDNSVLLIKVNYLGSIEWQRLIDRKITGSNGIIGFAVHQSFDSGYVVSGYGKDSAVLFKTNSLGDLLWLKQYNPLGLYARFFDHQITKDGGIIALGDIYPPDNTGFIVKTDSKGNVEWDSIYNVNFIKSKIIQSTLDESYYITGYIYMLKINSFGKIIWKLDYNYIGEDLIQTKSGDIYSATGNNAFYLNKVDTSGSLIWQKNYYPGALCTGLCLSNEVNLLLTGTQETLTGFEVIALKTDLDGKVIYQKIIQTYKGNFFAIPRSVNSTKDSGFIFSGITDYPNTAMLNDNAFVLKTDSASNAPFFVNINNNNLFAAKSYTLYQNYPNPFNPSTTIKYELYKSGFVQIDIYDINGKNLKNIINQFQQTGSYEITIETNDLELSSGTYFLRLVVNNSKNQGLIFSDIIKIIYLK